MSRNDAPVVITVAPTGAEVTRAQNPAVPYTPAEIAASTLDAVKAGASAVHLHVREPDGTPSGSPELFDETIRLIRAESDAVVMVSTGGAIGMTLAERLGGLEAGPDVAGVETGSVNFGGEEVFVTSDADACRTAAAARERAIALEVEAFDVGHVVRAVGMLEEGILPAPLRVNCVFGVPGGIDATAAGLAAMIRPLPADAIWTVTAVGRHQQRMLALGLLDGATGIRVGLEDNIYVARGQLAESNAHLVRNAAELAERLGRRPATPAEARELLQVPARAGAR